jgi:hypothetical protein
MRPRRSTRAAVLASCALAAAVAGRAQAQTFGPKAGVAWSSVAFDRDPAPADARAAAGLIAGGFLEIPVGGRLSVQADVLFVERRTEFADAPGSAAVFTDKLRYLEIPVVGRYRLFDWSGTQVAIEGGLGFSRLLTAREKYAGGDDDISAAIEARELSAVVGGTVDWRQVTVGVRYLYGLSDIYRAEFFPAQQRTLQVSVGYRLR